MLGRLARVGAMMLLLLADPGAAAAATVYQYDILHPRFGRIGLYTNTITRDSGTTDVETDMSVKVRVLGIPAYSMTAQRHERWQEGRLVAFDGVTKVNGDTIRVTGRAEGDHFIIDGVKGRIVAPADVYPTNPWSERFQKAQVLMSTRTGRLDAIKGEGEEQGWVELNGRRVPARHYTARGRHRYEIWFSTDGVPLRFALDENGTMISFVLKEKADERVSEGAH